MLRRIFTICLFVTMTRPVYGAVCYTIGGTPGQCVNIFKCNSILELIKDVPLSSPLIPMLERSQCGFEGSDPKVCCPIARNNTAISGGGNNNIGLSGNNSNVGTDEQPSSGANFSSVPLPVFHHRNIRLLDDKLCGPIFEAKIYDGRLTSIFEFPWMALLAYETGSPEQGPKFQCGASLINNRYVLTAAHCTAQLPSGIKLIKIRIGEYDLSQERDCDLWENGIGINCADKYQEFGIERVHVHPEYERHKLKNDIALVRMNSSVDLSSPSVRPICLPIRDAAILKSKRVVVTGWGATEFGIKSPRLLKVTLPIVDIEKCAKDFKHYNFHLWEKQICAGGENKMDSCSGDSGGPLQAISRYNAKLRYVLYGIVSFGFLDNCGIQGFPAVYTNVVYYVDWILDTITD